MPTVGYLFRDRFGRPARGNDKGKVEGLVKFARNNFMVPVPVVACLASGLLLIGLSAAGGLILSRYRRWRNS